MKEKGNLRRRQRPEEEPAALPKIEEESAPKQQQPPQRPRRPPSKRTPALWKWIAVLLHLVACGVYIGGLVLQKDLHSSVECEMTYSRRQLIPIPTQSRHAKYSLHKFVDQRDPRPHHQAMLKDWVEVVNRLGNEEQLATEAYLQHHHHDRKLLHPTHHCSLPSNDAVAVLYIPGHWGSYMQSRSIGAHGIQLTGASNRQESQKFMQAMRQQEWKGVSASSLEEFEFDVYSINFQEEGGALHAQLLWAQTAFVAQAIQEIVNTCQLSQILILGHSIGGYVARLVPTLYPDLQPYISNIVTLGSPHAHPVFGWEASVHQLHQTYLKEESHTLVALSGGVRDEMIPPAACKAPNASLTILSPEIMKSGPKGAVQPQFGMDHRAIVWCHNLLSVVRGVIYTLVRKDNQSLSSSDRLEVVRSYLGLKDTDYDAALERHQEIFVQQYGLPTAIALEASMLYHTELLVGLFVIVGLFRSIGSRFLPVILVATTCLAARTNYQIHILGLALLTLVAHSVFFLLQWIFGVALPSLINRNLIVPEFLPNRLRRVRFLAVGVFLVVLGGQCIGKLFGWQVRLCLAFLMAVYFGTLGTAVAMAANRDPSMIPFAVTLVLLCPFLVAGKIVALQPGHQVDNMPAEYHADWGLLMLSAKLLLPIALRMAYHHFVASFRRGPDEENMRAVILIGVILYFGPSLFQMGQGYRAGHLLSIASWLECFFLPLI